MVARNHWERKRSSRVADEALLDDEKDVDEQISANGDGPEMYDDQVSLAQHMIETHDNRPCQCHVGQLVLEFFGNNQYSDFPEPRLRGRGNFIYFLVVLCCLIVNLILGCISLGYGCWSFYHDIDYSDNIPYNELIRSNDHHLSAFFGENFTKIFRRESKSQAVFVFTSGFTHMTYVIVVTAFIFINHYAYRVHFIILFHIHLIALRIMWGVLEHYSLSTETRLAVELGEKLREGYLKASLEATVNLGRIYSHVSVYTGKLLESPNFDRHPRAVFEYCGKDQKTIPEDVFELINEFSLCPDNDSKEVAVYLIWITLGMDVVIFTVCVFWRIYATNPSRIEEQKPVRRDSEADERKQSFDERSIQHRLLYGKDQERSSSSSSSSEDQFQDEDDDQDFALDRKRFQSADSLRLDSIMTVNKSTMSIIPKGATQEVHSAPLRDGQDQTKFKSREDRQNVIIGKRHFPVVKPGTHPHHRKDSDVW